MKQILSKLSYLSPWLIVRLYRMAASMLLFTCKIEVSGVEQFKSKATNGSCSIVLWHDRLGILAKVLHKFAPDFNYLAVLSNSRDGHVLAQLATSYKQCDVLFVPHDAREIALRKMVDILKNDNKILIVTPDGPRGPRHKLKPGIVLASMHAESSIVPLNWECDNCWMFKSWDKMALPKPFSKIKVNFGNAIQFHGNENLDVAVNIVEEAIKQI